GFSGRANKQLIELAVAAPERPPAELDGFEAAGYRLQQFVAQAFRLVEEKGAVGLDAIAVAAAEKAGNRLIANLAHKVPEGDVDAADGVHDGAAPSLREQ